MSAIKSQRLRTALDIFVTVAMGLAALVLLWRLLAAPRPSEGRVEAVEDVRAANLSSEVTADLSTRGARTAPIVLVEFADFECPYCGRHARETFEQIDREFIATGKVLYAFRHLPLPNHRHAVAAARAAECAARQNKFWEMRKYLYANQASLADAIWLKPIAELDLDSTQLAACIASTDDSRIKADREVAYRLGVRSTPTFLVGKLAGAKFDIALRVNGSQPYSVFQRSLDQLLRGGS